MTGGSESRTQALWWVCLAAMAILVFHVLRRLPDPGLILMGDGGDDVMRLQQVRDWLAGQGWFDTQQYRVLPPEGISMHWSRYVDLGIAAFLVPASWVLPLPQAELAAVILWPLLLGFVTIVVIAQGMYRLLGLPGVVGGLVTFLSWTKLGGEFTAGRLDHHNIQILVVTAIFFLSVVPGRSLERGLGAGALTAFSLAIGLEMLPLLALLWGLMVLRHAFGDPESGRWLTAFCAAFAIAAPLLLVGQTSTSDWFVAHCDVLATPVLSLATVGIAATLAQVTLAGRLRHPAGRIVLSMAVTAGGLWLAAPLLLPCLAGPYSGSGPEVRAIIETLMIEALPATTLFHANRAMLFEVLLPPLVIAGLALVTLWPMRRQIDRTLGIAMAYSFAVLLLGLGFAMLQIRAANLMTPAVPVLAGFLVHAFATMPREHPLRAPAALTLLLAMPAAVVFLGGLVGGGAQPGPGQPAASMTDRAVPTTYCRTMTALAELNREPPAIVFSSLNLGPAIVAFTHHSATSAGYHRSVAAYTNGVIPFLDPDLMRDALASSRAEYLAICVGAGEERIISRMEAEGWPDWLTEVTGDRIETRLFKVDQAAVARAREAP